MPNTQDPIQDLDRYGRPGFITRGDIILRCNADARSMLLTEGTDVKPLLGPLWSLVETMGDGEFFAPLAVAGTARQACISKITGGYLFLLEALEDESSLQAMALAAQQLRGPLNETLLTINLLEKVLPANNEEASSAMCLLRRSFCQLRQITDNMSAGHEYLDAPMFFREPTELREFFDELFQTAVTLTEPMGKTITFHASCKELIVHIDRQAVERCVYNILSNALKFLPKDGHIHAELLSTASHAILRVTDNGSGLPKEIRDNLFTRYRRRPTIEDGRHGLGLGLYIVRSIVAAHGGAVYAGTSSSGGTEITISLSRRSSLPNSVNSLVFMPEVRGLMEMGKTELSELLPVCSYENL